MADRSILNEGLPLSNFVAISHAFISQAATFLINVSLEVLLPVVFAMKGEVQLTHVNCIFPFIKKHL